jgi:hypothetical protein
MDKNSYPCEPGKKGLQRQNYLRWHPLWRRTCQMGSSQAEIILSSDSELLSRKSIESKTGSIT